MADAMQSRVERLQRALYLPLTILAWLAVVVIVAWLLGYVTKTLLMIALSGVLAFALAPLANLLARWLPRTVAIGAAYLTGVGVVVGLCALVIITASSQISALVNDLPTYAQQAQAYEPWLVELLRPFGVTPEAIATVQDQALTGLEGIGTTVARESVGWLTQFVSTLIDAILVLILSIYFAANGPSIAASLRDEVPTNRRRHAHFFIAVVNRVVGGYVRGTFTLAGLIGVLVGVGLWLLGVPYAALLGVLAFFMEFIPVIGVFITGAAAVTLALFQSWQLALIVLGYFAVAHIVEADVIGPRILGQAIGIHPATGLVAFIAGTELFGIWGALFAAPVAGLLQAVAAAAWLELRHGKPGAVASAVADHEADSVERRIGVPVGGEPAPDDARPPAGGPILADAPALDRPTRD